MMSESTQNMQHPPTTLQRFKASHFWHSFKTDRVAQLSFIIFVTYAVLAMSASFIAPYDPYDASQIDIMNSEIPPGWQDEGDAAFLLGTDAQGRDMLSTILYGTRVSLMIGLCAVALQALLGIVIGLTAGYLGGRVDSFLMRIADIQLSFSTLMVAIIVLAVFQATFGTELYQQLALKLKKKVSAAKANVAVTLKLKKKANAAKVNAAAKLRKKVKLAKVNAVHKAKLKKKVSAVKVNAAHKVKPKK